jgi:hypothetical protein
MIHEKFVLWACKHAYTRVHTYTYIRTYHIYIIYIYIYIYIYTHTHTNTKHSKVWIRTYMHIQSYIHVHTHKYINTSTQAYSAHIRHHTRSNRETEYRLRTCLEFYENVLTLSNSQAVY